ncbi:MAG: aminotransferase class I/II-fold pyridoxal phosphate-dependent enzyme [Geminicoccaceae bacterium]
MISDRFGNTLDPSVGYARGRHLASSADEIRRLRYAQAVAADVIAKRGTAAIGIFTGNPRYFPLKPEDLETYCEEWVGPGLFARELADAAIDHLGGGDTAVVTNRTSAGIVAAILALSAEKPVVSVVPDGDRSHTSVVRGCKLAGARLIEIGAKEDLAPILARDAPALVVVTTVTSTLARMSDDAARTAVRAAKAAGAVVFLDEAYGARLRPVLHGGVKSLELGADLAITNADKAGLSGPRAGIITGAATPVFATLAKASELGQEARAPIAAGAMRSLQQFDPEDLLAEARDGQAIADVLAARWGDDIVRRSDLGPMIDEQDVMSVLLDRAGRSEAPVVPAEATAAIGMILLRDNGVLTVNTHGAPGGRVSIRLKPTTGALESAGGAAALIDALERALEMVAARLDDDDWLSATLFGTD